MPESGVGTLPMPERNHIMYQTSTYKIGIGCEVSLIPIHVIQCCCTDSYPEISFLFKISCCDVSAQECHRHLRVDICWMSSHTSSVDLGRARQKYVCMIPFEAAYVICPHESRISMGSMRNKPLYEKNKEKLSNNSHFSKKTVYGQHAFPPYPYTALWGLFQFLSSHFMI